MNDSQGYVQYKQLQKTILKKTFRGIETGDLRDTGAALFHYCYC